MGHSSIEMIAAIAIANNQRFSVVWRLEVVEVFVLILGKLEDFCTNLQPSHFAWIVRMEFPAQHEIRLPIADVGLDDLDRRAHHTTSGAANWNRCGGPSGNATMHCPTCSPVMSQSSITDPSTRSSITPRVFNADS